MNGVLYGREYLGAVDIAKEHFGVFLLRCGFEVSIYSFDKSNDYSFGVGFMHFRLVILAGALGLSCAPAYAANFPLYLQEEDVPLVTNYSASSNLYTLNVSQPVLCANTGPATGNPVINGGSINPVYPNFVFGALAASPAVQRPSMGLTNVQYKTSQTLASYLFQADSSLGTPPLVCYVTDLNGVRKPTGDLFKDSFDYNYAAGAYAVAPAPIFDSKVVVTVEPTTPPAGYYKYYVDITIPPPTLSATFVLRDGYNTRVFKTSTGTWCQAASTNSTICPNGSSVAGDIDYTRTLNSSSPLTQVRFIVVRQYNAGITPNSGELLALAALFSPSNIAEVPLGNNVAAVRQP